MTKRRKISFLKESIGKMSKRIKDGFIVPEDIQFMQMMVVSADLFWMVWVDEKFGRFYIKDDGVKRIVLDHSMRHLADWHRTDPREMMEFENNGLHEQVAHRMMDFALGIGSKLGDNDWIHFAIATYIQGCLESQLMQLEDDKAA